MFGSIAHLMYRRRWYVLGAWFVALIVAGVLAAQAPSLLGAPDYTFKASDSGRVATILDKTFHQNGLKTTLVILSSPAARVDDASFRSAVQTVVSRLRSDPALRVDRLDNPLVSHD